MTYMHWQSTVRLHKEACQMGLKFESAKTMGLTSKRRMTKEKGKLKQRIPEAGFKMKMLKEESKTRKQGRSNTQF
jgi:hypothetical protein